MGRSERGWTCAAGVAAKEKKLEMGLEKDWWAGASVDAWTCADGVGATERLEMGGEKGLWA